jgi:hypothetical protein
MTEQLWLIAGADSYQVHELPGVQYVQAVAGLGMPPVRHITQQGPLQDGVTLLDVRLSPRAIDLAIVNTALTRAAYWQARRLLLSMLSVFDALVLRAILSDTGESFDIDVAYDSGVELDSSAAEGALLTFMAALRLIAHDPVWRSTAPTALSVGIPGYGGVGDLPWTLPVTLGTTAITQNMTINYLGTWRAYPIISIRGPIHTPKIQNLTTGEKLEFTTNIDDGDVVEIDLSPLAKTVWHITDNITWIDKITSDSDLATWHLGAAPEAVGGVNALYLDGHDGGAATAISLRWNDRYIGI